MADVIFDRVLLGQSVSADSEDGLQSYPHRALEIHSLSELDHMDELYDLKSDPYEMKNLINQPHAAKTLADMKRELERLAGKSR